MPQGSLRDLYIDELRDLYSAETQVVRALPKMAKAASHAQLREAFEEHLRETSEQVSRLEQIFEMLDEKPSGKKCLGMEAMAKAGERLGHLRAAMPVQAHDIPALVRCRLGHDRHLTGGDHPGDREVHG